MFTYSVHHPLFTAPLVFESALERSDNLIKWTAVQHLEANPGLRNAADWVKEMDRMIVGEEDPEDAEC